MSQQAQNRYNDLDFFDTYSKIERSIHGLEACPEWPTVRAMLPSMRGKRVLDLGCGYGWFSRWALERGAASALAVDASDRMLDEARFRTGRGRVAFERCDLERADFGPAQFDLAYSSMTFHYVAGTKRLFERIHSSLVPGGRLVFTVEHPILTAPDAELFTSDAMGGRIWPMNRYLETGPRMRSWLAGNIRKEHRPVATYVNDLIAAGFTLERMEEWSPTAEQLALDPTLAEHIDRPIFLIFQATATATKVARS